MVLEEVSLGFKSNRNGFAVLDITLTTVDDWDVSQTERDDAASKDIDDIRSLVPKQKSNTQPVQALHYDLHQIDLCQHTNCPRPLGVHLACQF